MYPGYDAPPSATTPAPVPSREQHARDIAKRLGLDWNQLSRSQRRKLIRGSATILARYQAEGFEAARLDREADTQDRCRGLYRGRVSARKGARR